MHRFSCALCFFISIPQIHCFSGDWVVILNTSITSTKEHHDEFDDKSQRQPGSSTEQLCPVFSSASGGRADHAIYLSYLNLNNFW
jgi:hypothetical protein